MSDRFNLTGQAALITGGASGIVKAYRTKGICQAKALRAPTAIGMTRSAARSSRTFMPWADVSVSRVNVSPMSTMVSGMTPA